MEKIKLELSPPKKFNPLSYKDKQYIEEEKRVELFEKYLFLEKRTLKIKR